MGINEQFVRACENGDYSTVHRILENNPKLNIDVTNQLGRTALQLAIENEHLEVREISIYNYKKENLFDRLLHFCWINVMDKKWVKRFY